MSDMLRRDFMAAAAAFAAVTTATLAGTKRAEAGDPSFMNNVPDPLLAGKELPTFKWVQTVWLQDCDGHAASGSGVGALLRI